MKINDTYCIYFSGDVPYYIVKNSWGLKFGDSGYMKIAIGKVPKMKTYFLFQSLLELE